MDSIADSHCSGHSCFIFKIFLPLPPPVDVAGLGHLIGSAKEIPCIYIARCHRSGPMHIITMTQLQLQGKFVCQVKLQFNFIS